MSDQVYRAIDFKRVPFWTRLRLKFCKSFIAQDDDHIVICKWYRGVLYVVGQR